MIACRSAFGSGLFVTGGFVVVGVVVVGVVVTGGLVVGGVVVGVVVTGGLDPPRFVSTVFCILRKSADFAEEYISTCIA